MTTHELATVDHAVPASAAEIRAQVNLIQEVMRAVMKDGTHFGKIPGTPKPTLLKPGSEKILSTFRIAIEPVVEDLSTPDVARYRVITRATSQATGAFLGAGVGECSSAEEKYAWREVVCDAEWTATPDDRKRIKFKKVPNGKHEEIRQVRTNAADVANTVLKMAKKRSQIDACLTVTAASDVFAQDIEDLPEELRHAADDGDKPIQAPVKKDAPKPAPSGGLRVTGIESKSGKTAKGRDWMLYIIAFSDGRKASTFDSNVALLAEACKAEGAPVDIVTEPGKTEGSLNLVEIQKAEPEPF